MTNPMAISAAVASSWAPQRFSAEVPHPFATAGPLAHGRLGEASTGAIGDGWMGPGCLGGQQSTIVLNFGHFCC